MRPLPHPKQQYFRCSWPRIPNPPKPVAWCGVHSGLGEGHICISLAKANPSCPARTPPPRNGAPCAERRRRGHVMGLIGK
jgi:hypothetical protein